MLYAVMDHDRKEERKREGWREKRKKCRKGGGEMWGSKPALTMGSRHSRGAVTAAEPGKRPAGGARRGRFALPRDPDRAVRAEGQTRV